MKTAPEITINPCKKENIKTIVDGLNSYNLSKVSALSEMWTPLEFIATNSDGEEIGGDFRRYWILERIRN